jgi:uncharacterized membrane protein
MYMLNSFMLLLMTNNSTAGTQKYASATQRCVVFMWKLTVTDLLTKPTQGRSTATSSGHAPGTTPQHSVLYFLAR